MTFNASKTYCQYNISIYWERLQKEAAMAQFKVILLNLRGGTEENYE
jgi:hypothetical protein